MLRTGLAILALVSVGAVPHSAAAALPGNPAATPAARTASGEMPSLVRFKAFLFNRDTGTFSADVLDKSKPVSLGNVVASQFASDSTFVSLEVRAPARSIIPSGTRIRFKAVDSDEKRASPQHTPRPKVLLDRIVRTSIVEKGASTFVGFWLPDTGCSPIALSAEWADMKALPKLADTLFFVCYE
jgi:hypothetical protein